MDFLSKSYTTHVKYSAALEQARSFGFAEENLHEMLSFHAEVGAVVYFGKNKSTGRDVLSDIFKQKRRS